LLFSQRRKIDKILLIETEGEVENEISLATLTHNEDATLTTFIDKVIEINVKSVNITIVSDYVAELALFYIYLKVSFFTLNTHTHTHTPQREQYRRLLFSNSNFGGKSIYKSNIERKKT
jgi:hypothetical protein